MRLESEHFATFVPADPPRAGALAVWGDGQGSDELDLVLPAGGGTRRRRVRGRLLPLASALPALLAPAAGSTSASVAAWSAAAATGVGLVARGRLLPAASHDGYGAWRVGPLDAADLDWLRRIAAAMPPQGHAVPVEGRHPLRLRSPEGLVRELWDAIADTLVRTPAAVHATGARAFAAAESVLSLDLEADLARRAAGLLGERRGIGALAASAGMPPRELLRWAVTWQQAGRGGLEALRTTWQPAATDLAEGRAALDRPAGQSPVRAWRNRLTRGGLQLRLGSDGLWYRFLRSGSDWVLDDPPAPDPDALVADASANHHNSAMWR